MERNIGCKHTCCQMTWSFLIRPIKTEIRSNVWKLDILKTSVEAALTFILPWSAPWSRKVPKQVFFSKAGWKEISRWIAHRYAGTSMAVYQHVRMWLNQKYSTYYGPSVKYCTYWNCIYGSFFFISIRRLYHLFWSFKACVLATPKIDTDVIVFLSSFPTWFIAKLLVLPKALI